MGNLTAIKKFSYSFDGINVVEFSEGEQITAEDKDKLKMLENGYATETKEVVEIQHSEETQTEEVKEEIEESEEPSEETQSKSRSGK